MKQFLEEYARKREAGAITAKTSKKLEYKAYNPDTGAMKTKKVDIPIAELERYKARLTEQIAEDTATLKQVDEILAGTGPQKIKPLKY